MTLPPERLGDKGQRFEVHAMDYPNPGENVFGWCSTREEAERMENAIKLAPRCTETKIIDREKKHLRSIAMETVSNLERRLKIAREEERQAKKFCTSCKGEGYFCDSTYDRVGFETQCSKCRGTGLPAGRFNQIIDVALTSYRKWPLYKPHNTS